MALLAIRHAPTTVFPNAVVLGDGEKPRARLLTIEAGKDGNPAAVAFKGVWENERGFPDAVESRARADSEGQNEHAESRHATLSEQSAQAVANVVPEMIPPEPAAGFVRALPG